MFSRISALFKDKLGASKEETINEFVDFALNYYPDYFADKTPDACRVMVTRIYEKAVEHGIKNKSDIACAIALAVKFGDDFFEAFWAKDVVCEPDMPGSEKMQILRKRVLNQPSQYDTQL